MNPIQQWLNNWALSILSTAWDFISLILFWICTIGIAVYYLIFIATNDKKSATNCIKLFIYYLLIHIVKAAIACVK